MNKCVKKSIMAVAVVSMAVSSAAEEKVLPGGYTKLAYIASTGTQYINTGVQPADRTSVTMDIGHFRRTGEHAAIFGCQMAEMSYFFYTAGTLLFYGGNDSAKILDDVYDWAESDIHVEIYGGDGTKEDDRYVGTMSLSVNGGESVAKKVVTSFDGTVGTKFCVFAVDGGSYKCAFRLYGLTMTSSDGVRRLDLVPCIAPSGDIGVYDLVGNRFLGNSGTGRFLTPSDVERELIVNGGFDNASSLGSDKWRYAGNFTCEGWTFGVNSGLTLPNTPWASKTCATGKYAAFFQPRSGSRTTITQTFTVDRPGDYILTFDHARRSRYGNSTTYAELVDENNEIVGESHSVTNTSESMMSASIAFNGLSAGAYMVRFAYAASSTDNGFLVDNVSFKPAANYVEEGSGLFVYDGDFSLGTVSLADKDFVLKKGTGDLAAPAATTSLPSVRINGGTLNVQDGVATAYSVDGALTLDAGAVLKVDLVDGVCDSFDVNGLDLSNASHDDPVQVDVIGADGISQVNSRCLLISGAGLSAGDARKFRSVGVKGRFMVESGDLRFCPPMGFNIIIR